MWPCTACVCIETFDDFRRDWTAFSSADWINPGLLAISDRIASNDVALDWLSAARKEMSGRAMPQDQGVANQED